MVDAFDAVCRRAAAAVLAELRERTRGRPAAIDAVSEIALIRYADVAQAAQRRDPAAFARAAGTVRPGTLPDRCRSITRAMWELSGLKGPAVVTGLGSTPYLATRLSNSPWAAKLARAAHDAAAAVGARFAVGIATAPSFAGISDMSFFGEGDAAALDLVIAATPVLADPAQGFGELALAGIPIVNAGPWGRDYHTPLERLETRYAFGILPALIEAMIARLLPSV